MRSTGTDPFALLKAICVDGLADAAQEGQRVLGVLGLGRGDEDVDDREEAVAACRGRRAAPKSLPSCAPAGDELPVGRVVHGLERAAAGGELLRRRVPGQARSASGSA